jgi:8-oxo-dGTP diphosphatase
VWGLVKEVARHVLRRPVVGLVALARDEAGRVLLIRRGDTGEWAPPGGTLEWGETLRATLPRELLEEAGVELLEAGELLGVYSDPKRDLRFHAVTLIVGATVGPALKAPMNPLEVLEVRFFDPHNLPTPLAHALGEAVQRALAGERHWE